MVAAAIRSIFSKPTYADAHAQLEHIASSLDPRCADVAKLLREAGLDITANMQPAFPDEHRRKLHSTNPIAGLNKEIKRRYDVVGIFPDRASLIRLVGAVLLEQDDEWAVGRRYMSAESMRMIGARSFEEEVGVDLLSA